MISLFAKKQFGGILFMSVLLFGLFAPFSIHFFEGSRQFAVTPTVQITHAQTPLDPVGPTDPADPGFTPPSTNIVNTQTTTQTSAQNIVSPPLGSTYGCNIGDIPACIVAYYKLFAQDLTQLIAELAGRFLDLFIPFSISNSSYTNTFISSGWEIVRDIANIAILFALLIAAASAVLGIRSPGLNRAFVAILIVGLLINFSQFFTKVPIDVSNRVAYVFYNNMNVVTTSELDVLHLGTPAGNKNISLALIARANHHGIIATETHISGVEEGLVNFMRITFAGFLNLAFIYVFVSAVVLFVARIIGLWLAIIFAPVAFITLTLPRARTWKNFGFKRWVQETLKLSFLAPVFMFFLFLVLQFLEKDIGKSIATGLSGNGTDLIGLIIEKIISTAFVVGILLFGLRLTKSFSGEMGVRVTNAAKKAGDLAAQGIGALATAGSATLAKRAAGAAAAKGSAPKTTGHSYGGNYHGYQGIESLDFSSQPKSPGPVAVRSPAPKTAASGNYDSELARLRSKHGAINEPQFKKNYGQGEAFAVRNPKGQILENEYQPLDAQGIGGSKADINTPPPFDQQDYDQARKMTEIAAAARKTSGGTPTDAEREYMDASGNFDEAKFRQSYDNRKQAEFQARQQTATQTKQAPAPQQQTQAGPTTTTNQQPSSSSTNQTIPKQPKPTSPTQNTSSTPQNNEVNQTLKSINANIASLANKTSGGNNSLGQKISTALRNKLQPEKTPDNDIKEALGRLNRTNAQQVAALNALVAKGNNATPAEANQIIKLKADISESRRSIDELEYLDSRDSKAS